MTLRPNLFGRISLAMYQGATALITPILPWHLKRRKNNAKEHPKRWREKLGHACQPRPQGQLVWINAVGLGEVMALRGLIAALHAARRYKAMISFNSSMRAPWVLCPNTS